MNIEPVIVAHELQNGEVHSLRSRYQHDVASYIAEMLTELRKMAQQSSLKKVIRAIDIAYYEAYSAAAQDIQRSEGPREPD